MTRKKTTSTATLDFDTNEDTKKPSVKEWWMRAGASFFVGFLSLWMTYELPSSVFEVCLGIVGIILFIIVPALCIIIATVKENDWA